VRPGEGADGDQGVERGSLTVAGVVLSSVRRSLAFSLADSYVGVALQLASTLLISRLLTPTEIGIFAVAAVLAAVSDFRRSGYDALLHADPAAIAALATGHGLPEWLARTRALSPHGENTLGATTHISVIDAEGMAAAMTTSNGEGCGHALPGLGIHVNNFLGEDDINPAGFHRLPAGSWMSTMMSPTLVVAGNRPCLALGSGGSNRIRSAILQALLNLLLYRRPPDEAVNAARLHVEGQQLWFESVGLAAGAAEALQGVWPGATRFDSKSMFFGGVNCVAASDGYLHGAGDRRRGGVVVLAES